MTDDMHVTRAELHDARAVAQIHVETWQTAYAGIVPDSYLSSLSVDEREQMWRETIERGSPELWVAKKSGAVLGWVAFGRSRDPATGASEAEIWAIYVSPAHWKSGVGKALWRRARAQMNLDGFKSVSLWAFPENLRAARFYEAIGFNADPSSTKPFSLGDSQLREIRYARNVEG
jgi:ribosomal protein S18 acetylase RimI-like enzyme